MARCFAVMGPSGSGKSTLVDRLAAGAPRATGDRLGVVPFEAQGERWTAIDCPGAIDFLGDCAAALLAADAAVICVSPHPGEAVLAAPYLRAVEAAGTPAILFVNRMDEARASARDTVAALQDYARHVLILRQIAIRDGDAVVGAVDLISERAWKYREDGPSALVAIPAAVAEVEQAAREALLERLSEFDDWLLEEIVEEHHPDTAAVYAICARMLRENRAVPALIGSALHGNGMVRLMKALRHEAPPVAALRARLAAGGAAPSAVCFHARRRRHVGKLALIRVLDGAIAPGAALGGHAVGALLDAGAEKAVAVDTAAPGAVVAAAKAEHLAPLRLCTADAMRAAPDWARPPAPMLARVFAATATRDDVKLSGALAALADDDPLMRIAPGAEASGRVVLAQGPLHLRAIREALATTFGLDTTESTVPGDYRETITRRAEIRHRHRKQTGGAGQFADISLSVEPAPRGAGFVFAETVKGGAVPKNYIPAVETGARDAMARGPLGFPVVDVAVTLADGQHHAVDSSDQAFRIAGRAGVASALAEAAPVLLQPVCRVAFLVPTVFAGALSPLVASLKGQVLGFDQDPEARGWDVFRALLPASALDELAGALRGATQGVGRFEAELDHFEEVVGRDADRITAARGRAPA